MDAGGKSASSSGSTGSGRVCNAAVANVFRGRAGSSIGAFGAGVGPEAAPGPGEMASGGIGTTTVCPAGASLHCARTIESTSRSATSPTVTATAVSRKRRDHRIGSPDGTGAVRRTTYQPGAPATGAPSDARRRGFTDPAGQPLTGRGAATASGVDVSAGGRGALCEPRTLRAIAAQVAEVVCAHACLHAVLDKKASGPLCGGRRKRATPSQMTPLRDQGQKRILRVACGLSSSVTTL